MKKCSINVTKIYLINALFSNPIKIKSSQGLHIYLEWVTVDIDYIHLPGSPRHPSEQQRIGDTSYKYSGSCHIIKFVGASGLKYAMMLPPKQRTGSCTLHLPPRRNTTRNRLVQVLEIVYCIPKILVLPIHWDT